MKTRSYRYGKFSFKSYYKTAGHGYEVGLTYGKKTVFVGNFIHKYEAEKWWKTMNYETSQFVKKYWINESVSAQWYTHFFSSHMYKTYYAYLDKWFANYSKTYTQAFKKDYKRYKTMKKAWAYEDAPYLKIA